MIQILSIKLEIPGIKDNAYVLVFTFIQSYL